MTDRKKVFILRLINTLIFATVITFQYNSVFSLKIQTANPMIVLALLVCISIFSSQQTAAFAGMITGIFVDCVSAAPSCFHTIVFLILGLAVSLAAHHLFNSNIFAACTLCFLSGIIYYLLRWVFNYAFSLSFTESITYLMRTAIPSALYTTVFIIPFYYLEKHLYKKYYHL